MRSIYIANGIGIFLMLMLFYVSKTRILSRHAEDKIYIFMIFGVMAGCFMEALSYTLDGRVFFGARILNYIANTYLFTFNVILPFCVHQYIDINLYGDPKRIPQKYRPQIIICLIMIALSIANFFVPLSYYITEQNVYERRPLIYLYYVVIVYYMVSGIVVTRQYTKQNGARPFININMFIIPILIGTGLQFASYGLSLAWLSSAVGLIGLYMMQQNETAYIDSMLEIYNRKYLDSMLGTWIDRGYSFAGMMLDIDYFKSINDRYGHSEGDDALVKIADVLMESRSAGEIVFRFAGDEFIVLRRTSSADGFDEYIKALEANLDEFNRSGGKPYTLAVSYGIGFFDGKGSADQFMKALDDNMYSMKTKHHHPDNDRS